MKHILYGDGIHDDYPAIQELLDSRLSEIALPVPEKNYLISKTLKLHGGQTLKLPRFAVIRLADHADCAMAEDDDFGTWKDNISIDGGIWDMNNANQAPNPGHYPDKYGMILRDKFQEIGFSAARSKQLPDVYTGFCMRFCRVRGLIVKNITFKNPVTYGVQIAYTENFDFSDILFDYTVGAPRLWNMDGVHVEGWCKNGTIRNLKGACHDDLVALTADDGLYGPIENITIDGIYSEHSHSAVRLLSHGVPVKNIKISNVYGSYYVYCIGITKYHGGDDERGYMKNIIIENVAASACAGTADVRGGRYPLIWVQRGLDIDGLSISNVEREEKVWRTPLLKVDEGATVKRLRLRDINQRSLIGSPVPLLVLDGETQITSMENVVNE